MVEYLEAELPREPKDISNNDKLAVPEETNIDEAITT